MEFETIQITDIKPAEYNPRIMKPSEQLKLKRGLETFGLVDPIIIDLTDNNTIIGGHQRYEVLKEEMGVEQLKLLKLGDIGLIFNETDFKLKDKNDQKALNLELNKISGEWDYNLLDEVLMELSEDNYDLELTGFSEDELILDDNMFDSDIKLLEEMAENEETNTANENNEELEKEDLIPLKQVETIIKEGDKYQLGNHILLCADANKMENIKELIGEEKIDLILTDPPYGINIVKSGKQGERESNVTRTGQIGGAKPFGSTSKTGFTDTGKVRGPGIVKAREYKPIINDDKPYDPSLLLELDVPSIIWGANNFSSKLPDKNQWIVWYKKSEDSKGNTFSDCELAWTNLKRNSIKLYKYLWSGLLREGSRDEELVSRVHPTQKPVGLLKNIITETLTTEDNNILDLYGGSGSTLIACEVTNNNCFMMELDPYYCQIIIDRWEDYTGNKAQKIEQ